MNTKNSEFSLKLYEIKSDFEISKFLKKIEKRENNQIKIQCLDPKLLVSRKQILAALYHTAKAFEIKKSIARDEKAEFLLRLSGQHQIRKALTDYGVSKTSRFLILIAFGGVGVSKDEEIESFVNDFKNSLSEIKDFHLPISPLKNLCEIFQCEENFEDLEKTVLERMASIDII